jgi:hypothetical protein
VGGDGTSKTHYCAVNAASMALGMELVLECNSSIGKETQGWNQCHIIITKIIMRSFYLLTEE